MTAAVLAVDGGNSKTDVALIAATGELLSVVRGPTISHQVIGARAGGERVARLVADARRAASIDESAPKPNVGVYCLAGADFPSDVRLLQRELARQDLAAHDVVVNDTFAALRAGAGAGWGVVLICGQGINGAGVAPDGRTARFAGIGDLSGDWGGAGGLGSAALSAAIRARDGRGPRTSLERAMAEHFGRKTPEAVMLAMYSGRLSQRRLSELAPAVFSHAAAGDAVARAIVDRLADELVAMATALIRRLRLSRQAVEVVLAGGVFQTSEDAFYRRLQEGVLKVCRDARFVRPKLPPVAGAALLGLDRLDASGRASDGVVARLAATFGREKVVEGE
jgi:N-acetylglucosamine kinase-like BadF-type ATPase